MKRKSITVTAAIFFICLFAGNGAGSLCLHLFFSSDPIENVAAANEKESNDQKQKNNSVEFGLDDYCLAEASSPLLPLLQKNIPVHDMICLSCNDHPVSTPPPEV